MNAPNTATQVNRTALTSSGKTKEDRLRELELLVVEAKRAVEMPEDVKQIVDLFSGQEFKLGNKKLVEVPPQAQWGQYEAKKGSLQGKTIFNCLGRFHSIPYGNIGNWHVSALHRLSRHSLTDEA